MKIPVLILSLIITVLAYGAFPFIFARVRSTPITKKKYNRLCYIINAVVMFVFIVINGEASSGAPYLLWTWIFSSSGIKTLSSRGVLIDDEKKQPVIGGIVTCFCNSCGAELAESSRFCRKCGVKVATIDLAEDDEFDDDEDLEDEE